MKSYVRKTEKMKDGSRWVKTYTPEEYAARGCFGFILKCCFVWPLKFCYWITVGWIVWLVKKIKKRKDE